MNHDTQNAVNDIKIPIYLSKQNNNYIILQHLRT